MNTQRSVNLFRGPGTVGKGRLWEARRGAVATIVGVMLLALIGLIACSVDIGWVALTRTQLHAVADSAALAGGTELLAGLGYHATKTPSEVSDAARAAATLFASYNPNGNLSSSYVDASRDIVMGKAVYDPDVGAWIKTPDATPYNYVEAWAHRDLDGGGADGLLPAFFGRIFNVRQLPAQARATAVILPANGFYVEPGSDDTAGLVPFTYRDTEWERYFRAQDYYEDNPNVFDNPTALESILDVDGPDPAAPLFGRYDRHGNFHQDYTDNFTTNEGAAPTSGPDLQLEVDIYPRVYSPGNFGTIDFGGSDNSTAVLTRQILEGLNADDMSHYPNSTITITEDDPLLAEGDTGISAAIQSALNQILGECRAMALFRTLGGNPGNNETYELIDIVGITFVEADLTGSVPSKTLKLQPCTMVDDNAVGDNDEEIGENTTVFTPLILIE